MSNSLYKETVSGKRQVPVTKATGRGRFGMLPEDVLKRTDISPAGKILLEVMNMESYGSGVICCSDSFYARKSGLSRSCIVRQRGELETYGLIEKFGKPIRQSQPYKLLHPDMCKVEQTTEVVAKSTVVASVRAPKPRCAQCHDSTRRPRKTGLCGVCESDNEVARVARTNPGMPEHEVKAVARVTERERRIIRDARKGPASLAS